MSPFMPQQEFSSQLSLTLVDAVRLLRLPRRTIYKLCKAGVLKEVWVGKSLRISTRSILHYILMSEQVQGIREKER